MEPQITLQSTKEACGFVDCPLPVFTAAGTESYCNTLCEYQAHTLRLNCKLNRQKQAKRITGVDH